MVQHLDHYIHDVSSQRPLPKHSLRIEMVPKSKNCFSTLSLISWPIITLSWGQNTLVMKEGPEIDAYVNAFHREQLTGVEVWHWQAWCAGREALVHCVFQLPHLVTCRCSATVSLVQSFVPPVTFCLAALYAQHCSWVTGSSCYLLWG